MPDEYDALLDTVLPKPPVPSATVPHLDELTQFAKEHGLMIGSTTGGTHNVGSRHYSGNAIDIKGSGGFSNEQVAALKQSASARGLLVRDERTRPPNQKVWGGPHIHVEKPKQDAYDDLLDEVIPRKADAYDTLLDEVSPTATTSRGDYMARQTQAMKSPDTGMRTVPAEPAAAPPSMVEALDKVTQDTNRRTAYAGISHQDVAHHFGITDEEWARMKPKQQMLVARLSAEAAASDMTKRQKGQTGFPVSLTYQNENRAKVGLPALKPPPEEVGDPFARVKFINAQPSLPSRDGALRERAIKNTEGFTVDPVANLKFAYGAVTKGVKAQFDAEAENEFQNLKAAEQRATTPEMISARKFYGSLLPLPGQVNPRAIIQPLARTAAGLLKLAAGTWDIGGLFSEDDASKYLRTKARFLEESASLPPLNATEEEVKRGLPEKTVAALMDTGLGIAEIVALKKVSGIQSLSRLLALETALKTSDEPAAKRISQIGESALMGKVLDQHLSRPASALLFGGPTAAREGYSYLQGGTSLEDALLQTAVQSGVGLAMGGKPKTELPKVPEEPSIEEFRQAQSDFRAQLEKGKQAATFHHRDLGLVTESESQSGVPKGRLRVTSEDGNTHLIKRPNGRGQGNNIAIPVRTVPAEAQPAISPETLPTEGVQQTPSTPQEVSPSVKSQPSLQGEAVKPSPREVIEAAGLKYLGEQQMPSGKPPGHMFNVGDATLMITGEVTPETVAQKVKTYFEKQAGLPVVPEPLDSVAQQAENVTRETSTEPAGAEPIREARIPARPVAEGAETEVAIPDSDRTYRARYVVRELEDVVPSHNSQNFQPRPDYYHVNDRQYQNEPQYQVQVIARSRPEKFNPRAVLNNSPTVEVGPSVTDSNGNVLGGNSRQMIIERIYAATDPRARDAYRKALTDQASVYGLDATQITGMRQPVLVRELSDTELSRPEVQRAITDLNRTSTTPLTSTEQASAAAGNVSEDAAKFITQMIERGGDDATIRTVMDSDGPAIINRLIEDGVIQPGERNTLMKDGNVTLAAKDRIEKMLVQSVYRDMKQMEDTPDGIKRNIERIIAPLRRIAGTEWDLADQVRTAIDVINEAKGTTKGNLDMLAGQTSLNHPPFTADEIALAKALRLGPRRTAEKFRGYANDYADARSGGGLFGAPTRAESLMVHFGLDQIMKAHLDPVVDEVAKRIIAAAEYGELGNLSASVESAPSETRMQIRGLTAEIAKEKASGQETASVERPVEPGSEAGAKVPEADQGTSRVPELSGAAGAEVEQLRQAQAEYRASRDSAENLGSEAGAVDLDLLSLGVRPFAKDVTGKAVGGVRGIKDIANDVRSILAPATRSPEAKSTALSTRANTAEMERQQAIADKSLEGARSYFSKQTPLANFQFIDRMERGQPQLDPQTQGFADVLRQSLDLRRDQIRALGTGKLEMFITDYFPHVWKDPKKAAGFFAEGRRPFEGQKSFLKRRTIPFTSEGLAHGLEPVSDNPIDLAVLKLREMDKYLMAHRVLGEMKDAGTLKFFKVSEPLPEGWKQIDDRVSTVYSRGDSGEMILRGRYAAPEPAAKIINNYLSPGIEATALREPFKAWRATANLLNQFQLGFSAFHAGFTTLDAAISRTAVGLEDILAYGKPMRGLKTLASTPISPITNLIQGSKMLREYYSPESQGAEIKTYVDAMVQGGGRAKQDRFYTNQAIRSFTDALKQGNIIGAAFRAPGAAVELLAKPTMEFLVPRQKMGVFAEMAKRELERLGPGASQVEVRDAMARAWDSVDNRMGQMIYDNLFWHKITKDLAMSSVRSVGWNLGTAREVGGGIVDYATLPKRAMSKDRTTPLFTHRMAYAAALPLVVGTMGAMTQYLLTGKGPDELKDYFFPKTGTLDESGNPERVAFPSYMKDIFPLVDRVKHGDVSGLIGVGAHMVASKAHPLIAMVGEMLSNQDYYGTEIRNPDDPVVQQLKDAAEHVGTGLVPFAIQGYQKERERDTAAWRRVLPFVGVTPAPKYLNQSEAERLLAEKIKARIPEGSRPKNQAERSRLMHQLESETRRGEAVDQELADAIEAGTLKLGDAKIVRKLSQKTPLQLRFRSLGVDDALDVFEKMTSEEKALTLRILISKRHLISNLPKPDQLATRGRFNKALAFSTALPSVPAEPTVSP